MRHAVRTDNPDKWSRSIPVWICQELWIVNDSNGLYFWFKSNLKDYHPFKPPVIEAESVGAFGIQRSCSLIPMVLRGSLSQGVEPE